MRQGHDVDVRSFQSVLLELLFNSWAELEWPSIGEMLLHDFCIAIFTFP